MRCVTQRRQEEEVVKAIFPNTAMSTLRSSVPQTGFPDSVVFKGRYVSIVCHSNSSATRIILLNSVP